MPKIKKHSYNKNYPELFEKEKDKILAVIPDCEVYHIGSTAVRGLDGKGIIDIMVAIENWDKTKKIVSRLKDLGYLHIHPKENERIFLSKDRSLSLDNIHIHIVKKHSKQYKELLAFRDYLRTNKEEAERYSRLKSEWLKESGDERDKYRKLKSEYIEKVLVKLSKIRAGK